MSRVYMPAGVGNDFVVTLNKKITKPKPEPIQASNAFPTEPVVEQVAPVQPTLKLATATASSSPFISSQPISNETPFLTRSKIGVIVACVAVLCVVTGGFTFRQRIHAIASDLKFAVVQLAQDLPKANAPPRPAATPQQITVSQSNLEAAITSLISQPVSIKMGTQTVSVSQANVMNWLNLAKHGNQTTISVNDQQVSSYLKQLASSSSRPAINRVILNPGWGLPVVKTEGQSGLSVNYSQSAYQQVTNDLLKGKGLNLLLPTASAPYKTVVTGSESPN